MSNRAIDGTAGSLDAVPRTYEEAVQALAAAHSAQMDAVEIYYIPDLQKKVVRLIEVSDAFPEGAVHSAASSRETERIVPVFPMGPARDFPFRSEVAQVKRSEWEELQLETLKLNRDWDLKQVRKAGDAQ